MNSEKFATAIDMKQKGFVYCVCLGLLIIVLFALNLVMGSVSIPVADVFSILTGDKTAKPSWQFIVLESRLPQAITATLCGGALAVSGLMLQTAFRNPLAGPSVFGINSGAGLGVALVMLLLGGGLSIGSLQVSGFAAVLMAAFIGAMSVMALIFFFSTLVRNNVMLLIVGIMIGYISNSAISLLNFFATDEVIFQSAHGRHIVANEVIGARLTMQQHGNAHGNDSVNSMQHDAFIGPRGSVCLHAFGNVITGYELEGNGQILSDKLIHPSLNLSHLFWGRARVEIIVYLRFLTLNMGIP